jgi:hypothetical protein
MNFQVPQFIDVEDKIFGPLSFRQFLEIIGGAGLGYIVYTFEIIPFYIRLIPIMAAVGLGLALAFYQINGRPFISALEAGLKFYTRGHLYIWKKTDKPTQDPQILEKTQGEKTSLPRLSESKLQDLSWSLDVNQKVR